MSVVFSRLVSSLLLFSLGFLFSLGLLFSLFSCRFVSRRRRRRRRLVSSRHPSRVILSTNQWRDIANKPTSRLTNASTMGLNQTKEKISTTSS